MRYFGPHLFTFARGLVLVQRRADSQFPAGRRMLRLQETMVAWEGLFACCAIFVGKLLENTRYLFTYVTKRIDYN